jgi:virulence-associated protein VagC
MWKTAEIQNTDAGQIVHLPSEFHLSGDRVIVRRDGQTVVLEPLRPDVWPSGFFESIRIHDASFCRPSQGKSSASLE